MRLGARSRAEPSRPLLYDVGPVTADRRTRRLDQYRRQHLVSAQRHPSACVHGIPLRVADQVLAAIARAGDPQRPPASAARRTCHEGAPVVTDNDVPLLGSALSPGGAQRGREYGVGGIPAPPWSGRSWLT